MADRQQDAREHGEGELFRLLVENVQDYAIFVIDTEGRVENWNPGAERLLGYPEAEMIGHSITPLFTPEDIAKGFPLREMQQALEQGRGNDDRWHVRKDGSRFWCGGTMTPLWDDNRQLRGFAKIMRDRTEWKRNKDAVEEQVRLAAFVKDVGLALTQSDHLTDMLQHCAAAMVRHLNGAFARIWTLDPQGTMLELRASAGQYTHLDGPHSRVPVGQYKIGLIAQERQPHLTNTVTSDPRVSDREWAQREGMTAFAGYPLLVEDRVVGVMAMFSRHELSDSTLEAMSSVANGVALGIERKSADAERRRHQEWLRVTLASIGDAVIATDTEGRITFLNPVAQDLTGWSHADAYGQPLATVFQILHEETRLAVESPVGTVLREGRVVGLGTHTVLIGRDGTERPIDDSAAPILDTTGSLAGVVLVFRDVTEQRRAEHQMRASEARKAAILETALDCIITMDAAGKVVEFNPAAEKTFGYSRSEAVGQELAELIIPASLRDRHREGMAHYLETGEGPVLGKRIELRALHANGTEFPVELAITRIPIPGPPLFTAYLRDISERKHLEESLRTSEGRFRGLMEQAPFSVQVFAPDGRTVRVNRAWEELWGVTLDQMAGYNVLADEQLEARGVLSYIRQAFAGEPAFIPAIPYDPNETLPDLTRHEDPMRWVAAVAYPLKDDAGQVREVVLVHDDITARMRAEAALRESEEKFRLMADTIPQLAWMAKPDGHIFWYNRRWYEYTGTTAEQMDGWGWQSVHDPDVLPKVLERWKGSIASGQPFDMVFPLRGADRHFRPFLTRVNPLRDKSGRILYWFGTNTDISEIKNMEEALRDADRRKDEFLATLAHELRNPLAPIRNSLQILKMPRVDLATVQQTRDMMERQVHHLVRLVDDLLDVSRVMRGKIELRREPVELATIVARAVETAQPLIEVQEHRLELSLPAESLLLDADPVRLAQVVCNLLTNAAKYTEANGCIWLTAQRDGDQAVLRVRDNGIGLTPEMLPHVFELFVQVDHASTKAQGGLGIGLTLVKNLVEMQGGTVSAHSAGLGKGCEFVVRLPLLVQKHQQPHEPDIAEEQAEPARSSGHRLLVVDDNQDAAISFAMLLRLQGHEVRVAHNGPMALQMAQDHAPDVVFLDIGMPGMDGYEVARQMRRQPGNEHVVLAALTGWGQQEDRRRTEEAGFNHHFVKPPDLKAVESLLSQLPTRTPGARKGS
ncbi:MAG: PAS domain S-box protein [Candidatus Eisenbacteria bacterium]